MFVINWWTALITIAIVLILFFYVHYRKPEINWGSSTQAHVYTNALQQTQKLTLVLEHVKNFRPQMLVLTGLPSDRPALVDLCSCISKSNSLMVCGHVMLPGHVDSFWQPPKMTRATSSSALVQQTTTEEQTVRQRHTSGSALKESKESDQTFELYDVRYLSNLVYKWLARRRVRSFYSVASSNSLRLGAQTLMQSVGLGKLKPNTLIIGFKSDWLTANYSDVDDYFNIIHDAFDLNYGVGILRIRGGLDCSRVSSLTVETSKPVSTTSRNPFGRFSKLKSLGSSSNITLTMNKSGTLGGDQDDLPGNVNAGFYHGNVSDSRLNMAGSPGSVKGGLAKPYGEMKNGDSMVTIGAASYGAKNGASASLNRQLTENMEKFHRKKQEGSVDVWWLFDDGGLTLLVPYILANKKKWKSCKLRVFMTSSKETEFDLDEEHKHMATLLSKFRIEYSSITMVTDLSKAPMFSSLKEFDELVADWLLRPSEGETNETHPWKITEEELTSQREKTYRQLRVKELLKQHSMGATFIVVTLPMPRKGVCSAGLYMSWIDTLTRDMPPIMLLRGNQESVLTYYS